MNHRIKKKKGLKKSKGLRGEHLKADGLTNRENTEDHCGRGIKASPLCCKGPVGKKKKTLGDQWKLPKGKKFKSKKVANQQGREKAPKIRSCIEKDSTRQARQRYR